jgi:hypothetical protein
VIHLLAIRQKIPWRSDGVARTRDEIDERFDMRGDPDQKPWLAMVDHETVHVFKFTTDLGFNAPESRQDLVSYWQLRALAIQSVRSST